MPPPALFSFLVARPHLLCARLRAGSFRGHIVEKARRPPKAFPPAQPAQANRLPAQVWCGGDSSFALTTTSALFSWGANQHGQLGQGHDRPSEPTPHSVVAVDAAKMTMLSVGRWHTLAVVAGTVWSWGRGCHGQLGWSGQPKMNRPRLVKNVDTAIKSALVVGVSAGENHSAAWTGDGRVVTWGCNMFGQLGYPYVDPRDPCAPCPSAQSLLAFALAFHPCCRLLFCLPNVVVCVILIVSQSC